MKNKFFKMITAFALIMALSATLAIFVSATEADATSKPDTFTVNGVEIPKFDFPTKPYSNVEDMDLPLAEIREAFNILPEFKYENGKYMISDIGADAVEIYNNSDYDFIKMRLEDGYWVAEIPENDINDPELRWNVYVKSEENKWEFYYHNEIPDRRVQFRDDYNLYSFGIYIDPAEDWMDVSYPTLERQCYDFYKNGMLDNHEVTCYFDDQDDWFAVIYNPNKTVNNVKIWHDADKTYYYLIPEYGWYNIDTPHPDYKIDTPVGYEDTDIEYFVSFAPCVIDCAHEKLIPATCDVTAMCFACGFVAEDAEALGHDMVVDEGVDPTCTEPGLSQGEHCSRCDSMTTPQITIPPQGHDMVTDDGYDPTCTEKGLGEGEHCTRCNDVTVHQEEIPALGHTDDNLDHICDNECGKKDVGKHEDSDKNHACDYGCTVVIGSHSDDDTNHICDYGCTKPFGTHADGEDDDLLCDYGCGTEFPKEGLSTGAVVGIVASSTATTGVGGFSIFWFIIRKKKLSDLIGLFKKS